MVFQFWHNENKKGKLRSGNVRCSAASIGRKRDKFLVVLREDHVSIGSAVIRQRPKALGLSCGELVKVDIVC